jgi:chromosome segregation ATPase
MNQHDSGNRSPETAEESLDQSGDNVLDELLEALRSDQGGARTEALKRALEDDSRPQGAKTQRITDLESAVAQLSNDIETESAGRDGDALGDVRSDLDSAVGELAAIRTAVDSLESTDAALETRIDDLEAAVTELADRFASLEESTRDDRSDAAEARETLDLDDGGGEPSEASTDRVEDDVARRIQHVEKNLNTRTTALASRIRNVEQMEERIDELEERIDARAVTLEERIDDVDATIEEAVAILQERTKSELSAIQSDLAELDDDLRSSIESLEDDVGALETHAADMTLWRNSIEEPSGELGGGPEGESR